MTRAVLDTNVYVSALVFGGKPAGVLQLAAAGAFQLIVSETIQAELLETLATRFAWPADRAAEVCAQLAGGSGAASVTLFPGRMVAHRERTRNRKTGWPQGTECE